MLLEFVVSRVIFRSLLIALPLFLGACDRQSAPKEQAEPAATGKAAKQGFGLVSESGLKAELSYEFVGRPAPDVIFADAEAAEVSLSNFAGKPLLVNIWATWCAPCKAEMPMLDALAKLEEGKMSVIAVSQDLQGMKPVQSFFDATGVANLEPYTDPDNRLSGAVGGAVVLPLTILYDSKGREVWRIIGGVEWDDAEVKKLLDEAV